MGKWIGGCLLVAIVFVVAAMWWGFQSMQNSLMPDGSASVMIAGSPTRVFASLAHGDSVSTWMAQGNTVTTTRRGPFVPGDTFRVEMGSGTIATQSITWQVMEVVPDKLIAWRMRNDTSERVALVRRDSISTEGDSTRVVSRLVSPLIDQGADSSSAALGLTGKLMMSMFRMQSKLELMNLKARIEGGGTAPVAPGVPF